MNITLSLVRRRGLSRADVDEITDSLKSEISKLEADVKKTRGDVTFWKSEMKKRNPKKRCLKCKADIDVWPFNDTQSYYVRGNSVEHVECPPGGGIKESKSLYDPYGLADKK